MSQQWRKGNRGASVVSDTPVSDNPDTQQKDLVAFYGGYLVAESIPTTKLVHLIKAAPLLLDAAKAALEALAVTPAESIQGARADALKRAEAKRALKTAIAAAEPEGGQ